MPSIKAAVVREKSGPFLLETVQLEEPPDNEVLVEIHGTGVCHTDIVVRDQYFPTPLPAVLGHEAGQVLPAVRVEPSRQGFETGKRSESDRHAMIYTENYFNEGTPMKFVLPASILVAALLSSACTTTPAPPTSPAAVGERLHGSGYLLVNGYLPTSARVDSLALLPAPPAKDTAAMADDIAAHAMFIKFRNTPRGEIAIKDAHLSFPKDEETPFSCAMGLPISEEATPHLNILLRRVMTDAGTATFGAKNEYKRPRPFMVFGESTCTPKEEPVLSKDGSYPSGHSALGWAQALVLSQLAPDRSDAVLQRGRAYGQSRVICNAHWKSDVVAGRMIGAAMVTKLQNNPEFLAQMQAAREEVAKARAAGIKPKTDCAAEAAALATTSKLAP